MQTPTQSKIQKSLGQIAFEAYNIHAFDKAWEELPTSQQNAWHIVGETVAASYSDWLIERGYLKEPAPVTFSS